MLMAAASPRYSRYGSELWQYLADTRAASANGASPGRGSMQRRVRGRREDDRGCRAVLSVAQLQREGAQRPPASWRWASTICWDRARPPSLRVLLIPSQQTRPRPRPWRLPEAEPLQQQRRGGRGAGCTNAWGGRRGCSAAGDRRIVQRPPITPRAATAAAPGACSCPCPASQSCASCGLTFDPGTSPLSMSPTCGAAAAPATSARTDSDRRHLHPCRLLLEAGGTHAAR